MRNIIAAGEDSILIYFGDTIHPKLITIISNATAQLKLQLDDLIIDLTPAYTSLLVHYNLNKINHQDFCEKVENCLSQLDENAAALSSKLIHIPVYYSFDTGLDLEAMLATKNLDLNSFIAIHSSTEYLVYAIGFSPVFAFLGEVDARIQTPRLATPRISIPAGSVGIADSQTAIYPTQSSGGWNIIGRTPLDLSLNNPKNIDKFNLGDRVKFTPITRAEYLAQGGQ
ncbi:Allophanate hydrolase 2 subunit 1 [uncultured Candidatus Thioglobus sp.]|nr:Allophanate hydrolase 2 subunit 1 [uncultured Candidatus Thioglobus sp.]